MIGKLGKEVKALKKILIVEDDQLLNRILAYNLTSDGYEVISVFNFDSAVRKLRENEFDVALLDINLPDGSGLDLCEEIRNRGQHTYIIFITANDKESDMLKGYEVGGADYVTKPFSPAELTARVDALFRRAGGEEVVQSGEISQLPFLLNTRNRTLEKNGQRIKLTQVEYSIMRMFMENPGKALSREEILDLVWGRDYFGELKIVDVNVRRLRLKIEDNATNPTFISTVWGYGYKWGT